MLVYLLSLRAVSMFSAPRSREKQFLAISLQAIMNGVYSLK